MKDVFVDCIWVRWGHITTFAVPVSIHNVEAIVVVCVVAMHCVQLGEAPTGSEVSECSAGSGVGQLVVGGPEGGVYCSVLVVLAPVPQDQFGCSLLVVGQAHWVSVLSSASPARHDLLVPHFAIVCDQIFEL